MFLLQGTACELHHEWVRVQVPMLPATFFRLCQVSQRLKRALVFCKEELNQDYAFVIWTFFTPCSPTCVVRGILVEDDACKYFLMPTNVPYVVESKKKGEMKSDFCLNSIYSPARARCWKAWNTPSARLMRRIIFSLLLLAYSTDVRC